MKTTEDKVFTNRLLLVAGIVFLLCMGVVFRIFTIQFVEGDYLRELAKKRTVKVDEIPANKGNVYSADGSLLATSIPSYTIRFDAITSKEEVFQNNVRALSDSLGKMFDRSAGHYYDMLVRARKNRNQYLLLARGLSYSEYMRVKSFPLLNLGSYKGGIIAEQNTVREHPIGLVAERTIGYEVVRPDGKLDGKGLEWAYRDYLNGKSGKRQMQKIGRGQWKPIRDENEVEPIDGMDVHSTIDVYIQDIAHHALLKQLEAYEADHGCVVVMEVKTGHIKAISNLGRNKSGYYTETVNYAVTEVQEPGSTFKVMDLIALFEDKLADTSTIYDSENGEILIHNRRVRDSKKGGYGKISLARGFELSSNTVLVKAVYENYKQQPQNFVNHIKRMGLHKPLGLQLQGEGKPVVHEVGSKYWSGTTLPWMAYGYSISLTPLQTLTLYNAIANDGVMVKPQFVSEIRSWDQTVVKYPTEVINPSIASKETLSKVRAVMENVVKRGTGSKLYSENFSMAGKTGTAQIGYRNREEMYYASSFAGYFPADQPKYSCIVVVHKPSKSKGIYGADVAGPVFKRIAQKVYTDVPTLNEVKDFELESDLEIQTAHYERYYDRLNAQKHTVPNVQGMHVMDAIALLENLKIKVKVVGAGRVKRQSISPGERIKNNQTIVLELS